MPQMYKNLQKSMKMTSVVVEQCQNLLSEQDTQVCQFFIKMK